MSGIEIAGLVLGAFPIICEAAAGLRGVFKDVGSWWRFEREFENFILRLEREHIDFSQTLDLLLDPIDTISQIEKQGLRDNPDSPLWLDLRIQKELEQRVQAKYHEWFMRQLRGINDALNELHLMLPFDKVEDPWIYVPRTKALIKMPGASPGRQQSRKRDVSNQNQLQTQKRQGSL
jgi:hypothetical protein